MSRIMDEMLDSAIHAMAALQDKSIMEAVERFQETHPGVEVEIVYNFRGECLGVGEKGKAAPEVPVRPVEINFTYGGKIVSTIKWP